jgi:hypothetical protein
MSERKPYSKPSFSTHAAVCDPTDPELPCDTFVCLACGRLTQACRVDVDTPSEDLCADCGQSRGEA